MISRTKSLTRGLFAAILAVGLATLSGNVGADAAPIQYCGEYSYTESSYTHTGDTVQLVNGMCRITFSTPDSAVTNIKLPEWLSSVDIYAIGGGGSGSYLNDVYGPGYPDAYTVGRGSGGGAGAVWARTGLTINKAWSFSFNVGMGGRLVQDSDGPNFGVNGGTTLVTYNDGTTTYTKQVGGGKSSGDTPTNNVSSSGPGGTVTDGANGSSMGGTAQTGTAGLAASMSNTGPYNGKILSGLGTFAYAGGSSTSWGDDGQRNASYGSGGGGVFIDALGGDFNCNSDCDGVDGAAFVVYSPKDYYPPLLWNENVQLNGTPAQGQTLTSNFFVAGGPELVNELTSTFVWYRCDSAQTWRTTYLTPTVPAGCTAVSGQTQSSYVLTAGDLGKRIMYRATATASGTGSTTLHVFSDTSEPISTTATTPVLTQAGIVLTSPTKVKVPMNQGTSWGEYRTYSASLVTGGVPTTIGANFDGSYAILTGLTAGATYTLQISQTNAAGTTAFSNTVSFTLPAYVSTPGALATISGDPRVGKSVSLTAQTAFAGSGSLTVTRAWFKCQYNAVSAATYYEVTTTPSALYYCTEVSSTDTPLSLTSAYKGFYVVAIEKATDSYSSTWRVTPASSIITDAPDAPIITSVTPIGLSSVTVNYTVPAFTGTGNVRYIQWSASVAGGAYGNWTSASGIDLAANASGQVAFSIPTVSSGAGQTVAIQLRLANSNSTYSVPSEAATVTMWRYITQSTAPTLTGEARVGAQLTLTAGTYVGNPGQTAVVAQTSWYHCSSQYGAAFTDGSFSSSACTLDANLANGLTAAAAGRYIFVQQRISDGLVSGYAWIPFSTIISGAPSAPTAPAAVATGASTATVTLTAPALVGASAINTYKYSFAAGPNFNSWSTLTSAVTSTTTLSIVGLSEGLEYKIKVLASNTSGDGPYSVETAMFRTHYRPVLLVAPTVSGTTNIGDVLTASPATSDAVPSATNTHAWFSCATANDALDSQANCTAISGANAATYTIEPSQSMKFIVYKQTATNAVAASVRFSAATAQVPGIPVADPSFPPTISGNAQVGTDLSATDTAGIFAGLPLPTINGRAWYSCPTTRVAGASLSDCTVIAGASSANFTITTTQIGRYVVYSATGSNNLGQATSTSAASAQVTDVPTAPTITSVALNGSGSVQVTIAASSTANYSAITGYEYQLDGTGSWVSAGSSAGAFTISSLVNGEQHTIRVRANNGVGSSPLSVALTFTALGAISDLVGTRGDSSVLLSWSNPVHGNFTGTLVEVATSGSGPFTAVSSGPCSGTSNTFTTCEITGLTNGTDYYARVSSVNENGTGPASNVVGPITPLSQNVNLSALVLKTKVDANASPISVTLTPGYAAGTRTYNVNVPANAALATVTPSQGIAGQAIKVNGTVTASGATTAAISLATGANVIEIQVESVERVADSSSTFVSTYTLNITRSLPNMSSFVAIANGAASSSTSTATPPLPQAYATAGITNVTNANVSAINAVIAELPTSAVASPAEIQAIVDAYTAILGQASGGTPTVTPTASTYAALGIEGAASMSVSQVALINALVADFDAAVVGTFTQLESVVNAVQGIFELAAGASNSSAAHPITVEKLAALGITGVTSENLAAVIAAVSATSDDGSGVNTLAKIQAIVDNTAAPAIAAVAAFTGTGAAPTPADFASAGVVGVTSTNADAIAALISGLGSSARDSAVEIQQVVDSFNSVIALTKGGTVVAGSSTPTQPATISAQDFANIGATAAAALNSNGITLLVSMLGNLAPAAADTAAEINAIATVVATITQSPASASVADFEALGLQGVTEANLAQVRTLLGQTSVASRDSFVEIQKLIDNAQTLEAASSFANLPAGPSVGTAAPTVQDYLSLGVSGVSPGNIAALNDAIRAAASAANPAGSWVASAATIQALIDATRSAPLAVVSGYSGSGTAPAVTSYGQIGVIGVTPANIVAINSLMAALGNIATDTLPELQAAVDSYNSVLQVAVSGKTSTVSPSMFADLGIAGVTTSNVAAVAKAIKAAGLTGVDSIVELQAVVAAAVAAAESAAAQIIDFVSNPVTVPSVQVMASSGVVGVTETNQAAIIEAIQAASPAPANLAEIQAIVDSVLTPAVQKLAALGGSTVPATSIRLVDFAIAGISGVSSTNQAAVVAALGRKPSAARNSVSEIQAIVDSINLVNSKTLGGANALPLSSFVSSQSAIAGGATTSTPASEALVAAEMAKPSVEDFAAIGIDIGVLADDPQGFEFFLSVLAKLPPEVVLDPVEMNKRVAIVIDLVRISSGREPIAPVTAENLVSLGFTGVTTTNLETVVSSVAGGVSKLADALVKVIEPVQVVRVRRPVEVQPVQPAPTTPVEPAPTTPVVVVPAVPSKGGVSLAPGSTTLSAPAKAALLSYTATLVKARVKSAVVTSTITIPANATKAQRAKAYAIATARATAVAKLVEKQSRTLRRLIKPTIKIVLTTSKVDKEITLVGKR